MLQYNKNNGGHYVSRLRLPTALLVGLSLSAPLLAQDLSLPYVPDRVLIRFVPGAAADQRAVIRRALQAQTVKQYRLVPGLEAMQTALDVPQALAVLASNPNILYAEPDYIVQPVSLPAPVIPSDEHFGLQWALYNTGQEILGVTGTAGADIDMAEVWNTSTGSGQSVIAVIDTGTQRSHPDLDDNIWQNPGEVINGLDDDGNGYVDDIDGWDFFGNDNDPDDHDGHGTHTAGTICAEGDNQIGVAGVLWDCQIMVLRFLGPAGGSTGDAIEALQYAVEQGVKVSNNSWGGGGYSLSLYDAIAAAGQQGHIFVAAAGNSGISNDGYANYPSSYDLDNIISVASITNQDLLAGNSNYGLTTVDLAGPGVNVASTYIGNAYYYSSGTSMATPHVTGVVALLQELNPSMSMSDVVDRVLGTARPVQALMGLMVTGGVLNAYNAIHNIVPPAPPPPPPVPTAPSGFTGTNNGDGTATLEWTGDELAVSYLIERDEFRTNGHYVGRYSFTVADIDVGASESYEFTDQTGKRNNRYRVAAVNENGQTWTSWIWVNVTTDGGDPDSGGGGGGSGRCHPKKGC